MTSKSKNTVFPGDDYTKAPSNDPESGLPSNPKPPVSKWRRIFISLLMYAFLGVQLAQAGLSLSTIIIGMKEGQEAIGEKGEGEYKVVELTFMGEKGYFLPEINSGLSLVNGTYNIPSLEALDESDIEFCLIFSDPALVDLALETIGDTTSVFYVQIVSIIILIFDMFDAVKPIFFKFKKMLFKLMKSPEPEINLVQSIFYKVLLLGVVASPRYLVLNYTGEDYENCVGFNDQNPFYVLDHAFFNDVRPGTMNTWKNNSMTVLFKIYQIFLAFLLIFIVGAPYGFVKPKNKKWKIFKWTLQFLFYVGSLGLVLFGLLYLIINWMLIAAQMKENAAVILSILFLSRDFINVFTVAVMTVIQNLWDSIQTAISHAIETIQSPGVLNIGANINFSQPGDANLKFGEKIVNTVKNAGENIKNQVVDQIKELGTEDGLQKLSDGIENKINNLENGNQNGKAQGKKGIFSSIKDNIKGQANEAFGNVKDQFVNDLQDGLKEGLGIEKK